MSIRMHIYGWSFDTFREVLGSGDVRVLDQALEMVGKSWINEVDRPKGEAWLRTLIERGYPLCGERPPVTCPDDGGLATVRMETEIHIACIYYLSRVISGEGQLDLAGKSSFYTHGAMRSLDREMSASQFTKRMDCGVEFFRWMQALLCGNPLFGDQFRSYWSYYSHFRNEELAAMLPVFQQAIDFRRPFPEGYPEEMREKMTQCLSQSCKEYLRDLIEWFGEIEQAGHDTFIYWT